MRRKPIWEAVWVTPGVQRGKIVLVVEDDPILLIHSVDLIEGAGFDVIEAHNADEAIAILETRTDIAIVFTDVEMPGTMDGLKLARFIRERWPPVHLILASGRTSPLAHEMPMGSRFFAKPYNDAALVNALHDMAKLSRSDGPSANA